MRPPFFAFYPADFANDINVEAMSTLAVGAYILLLCKAWQADPPGSLPNDDQILARLARMDAVQWAEVRSAVTACFEVRADGRLHQGRLRREYDKALTTMKARKKGGAKGAEITNSRRSGTDRKVYGSPGGSGDASPAGSGGAEAGESQTQIKNQNLSSTDVPPSPPPGGGTSVDSSSQEPYDPLRAEEAARKLFERRWNASGLRKFSRLSHSLHTRLATLLGDSWWGENYPAALVRAGKIPWLRDGTGRQKGAYDVSEFLRDPDEVRKLIDGVYDPKKTNEQPPTLPFKPVIKRATDVPFVQPPSEEPNARAS